MTREEIFAQVREALTEMFDITPEQVTLDADLRDDLDLDSIDAIDMAVRLQSIVGKRVELTALRELKTVSDVIDLIEQELAA